MTHKIALVGIGKIAVEIAVGVALLQRNSEGHWLVV